MSLIAIRNFSAPFTHRASLVALALVVLLFGILRISIGGESPRPRSIPLGSTQLGGSSSPFGVSGFSGNPAVPAQAAPEESSRAVSPSLSRGLLSPGSSSGNAPKSAVEASPPSSRAATGGALAGSASASFFKHAPTTSADQGTGSFSDTDVLEEILGNPASRTNDTRGEAPPQRPQGDLDAIERRLGLR